MKKTEKILKYLIYIGLVILLCTPFIFFSDLYYPYVTGKAFTFRIVVEILVAIWLILAILYPKYRPKKNWILISFVLFTLSLFFSNLFGLNKLNSFLGDFRRMEGWVTIVHLLGLLIVMGSVLRTKKEWYALFNISVIGSVVMFVLAIKQIIGFGNSPEEFETWGGLFRVYTTIGNPAFLAIYTLFNAFLSLLLLFKDTERLSDFFTRFKDTFSKNWPILFYIITFILNTWVLFQTGTRGAMLGFLGGLVLIGLLMAFLEKDKVIYKKVAIGLISAAVLFIGTIFVFKETSFVQNNQPINRLTSILEDGESIQIRIMMWESAHRGFKERPIIGWGQESFKYVYDKYFFPRENMADEMWADRAHNFIFDWLIAGGIFGLLFYLSIWFATVLSIFKTAKFANREKAILISMLAGYFVHLLFVFDVLVSYLYFVFILAFVYAITSKDKNKKNHQYQISGSLKKILITSIILITPFVVYLVNYQPYKAAGELVLASKIVYEDSSGKNLFYHKNPISDNIKYFQSVINRNTFGTGEARNVMITTGEIVLKLENDNKETQRQFNELKSQYISYVLREVQQQIKKDPNNSRYPFILSGFLTRIGQFEQAEKYALMTIKLSPTRPAVRIPLIRMYSDTNQSEKALNLARETFELDESGRVLWLEYAKVAHKFDKELFNELIQAAIKNGNKKWLERLPDEIKNNI